MRKLLLFILILYTAPAFGAQSFTIPVGTTTYGPISVSAFDKYAETTFVRTLWVNPAITLTLVLQASTDKGATFPFSCTYFSRGVPLAQQSGPLAGPNCELPAGATHVRAVVTVVGGSITISALPVVRGKVK